MTLIIQKPTGAKLNLAKDYVEGDRNYSNVSLLLHGDGTNGSTTITDSSPTPKTVTAFGNAQISTAQSKFGGASIAFDGAGDYLTSATNTAFELGSNDFTIEAFIYLLTGGLTYQTIVNLSTSGGGGIGFAVENSANLVVTRPGTAIDHTFSSAVSTGTWTHVALTRAGTSLRCFASGNQIGSTETNNRNYAQGPASIGIDSNLIDQSYKGYIDDLRIAKGIARYTANFTPPTAPFPDI